MVLDGEENKTLGVLLKQGFIGFLSLNTGGNSDLGAVLLGLLDSFRLELVGFCGVAQRLVFLVGGTKVKFLNWGFHVEVLDRGGSLLKKTISNDSGSRLHVCRLQRKHERRYIPASKESFARPLCCIWVSERGNKMRDDLNNAKTRQRLCVCVEIFVLRGMVAVVMVWSKVKNGMKAMGFCISLDALSRGTERVALGNTRWIPQ